MESLHQVVSRLKHDVCPNIIDLIVENLDEIAGVAQYMLRNEFKCMPTALKQQYYEKIQALAQGSLVDCQYLS